MIMETDVYNVEFDKQREAVFLKTFDANTAKEPEARKFQDKVMKICKKMGYNPQPFTDIGKPYFEDGFVQLPSPYPLDDYVALAVGIALCLDDSSGFYASIEFYQIDESDDCPSYRIFIDSNEIIVEKKEVVRSTDSKLSLKEVV